MLSDYRTWAIALHRWPQNWSPGRLRRRLLSERRCGQAQGCRACSCECAPIARTSSASTSSEFAFRSSDVLIIRWLIHLDRICPISDASITRSTTALHANAFRLQGPLRLQLPVSLLNPRQTQSIDVLILSNSICPSYGPVRCNLPKLRSSKSSNFSIYDQSKPFVRMRSDCKDLFGSDFQCSFSPIIRCAHPLKCNMSKRLSLSCP